MSMLTNLALYAQLRIRLALAILQVRWLAFRLRRVTGVDIVALWNRAETASKSANNRAQLIDLSDEEAAERAGQKAFTDTLRANRAEPRISDGKV
jgi:hypothetical protein